jgi:Fur family ferric uptake transcriptional regulator
MNDQSAPAAVAERLHAQGERLTPQRLMVLEVLQASGEHLTADEVFANVVARSPYVGRATIYRALAWLKEQGLVSVTDLGTGQDQYQYLADHRHHHTICLGCGRQDEFPDDLIAPLAAALHERTGFQPRLDHLAVFGYCRACQEQAATAQS